MAAVSDNEGVKAIPMADVDPIPLPNGSWSRVLVNGQTVEGNQASIGYSVFTVGLETADLSHETEELAYVIQGEGVLRLHDGAVPFKAGDALYVPAKVWHVVANTGDEDVIMVFAFPHPDYPPTEKR